MIIDRLRRFVSEYRFPHHLWRIGYAVYRPCIGFRDTLRVKLSLAAQGARVGEGFKSFGPSYIRCKESGSIVIGNSVTMISAPRCNLVGISQRSAIQTYAGATVTIGDRVGLSGVILSSRSSIEIGSRTKIGGNARIFDHDFHSKDASIRGTARDQEHVASLPVKIGEDVFVGCDVLVLKGSDIGDRSIIGAGAVVCGLKVPPDSVVGGNPAKVIGRVGLGKVHGLRELAGSDSEMPPDRIGGPAV